MARRCPWHVSTRLPHFEPAYRRFDRRRESRPRQSVPTDESNNFGDQSVFRQLLTRLGLNPFIFPAEFNLRVGLPAVLHGAVRLLHGRPALGCDIVERFVNCSTAQRIYIPSTALIIMDEVTGEWELRKFPDASLVRRVPYPEFAKALLAS